MAGYLSQHITRQFYEWERRGRGWSLWPAPVVLEPPFRPFLPTLPAHSLDDGRKASWLEKALGRLSGQRQPASIVPEEWEEPDDEPEIDDDDSDITEFVLMLPESLAVDALTMEQALLSLAACPAPLAFELVAQGLSSLHVQMACREPFAKEMESQLTAHLPEASIASKDNCLATTWLDLDHGDAANLVVEFGLAREFMLPLRLWNQPKNDPLVGLIAALSALKNGELGALQILFTPVRYPWAEAIFRSVVMPDGKAFFADAPEMAASAKQKISQPLFAASIRAAAQSSDPERTIEIVRGLCGALEQFTNPGGNGLMLLSNEGYDDSRHLEDFLWRRSRRSGMILNTHELLSLAHPPSPQVRSERLMRLAGRSKAAPALAHGHRLVLGENTHRDETLTVTLSPEQRTRHMHVVGASGTGKTTFLLNLIRQDIENGEGFAVLDPHGDLIDRILEYIPAERAADVVLFDPSDGEYPVGLSILEAKTELEKNLLASDLVAVFRRLSTSWGDQMNSILGNAIIAFLESSAGGTLAELRRFLVEPGFRNQFLKTVRDPEIVYYWQKEFPMLTGRPQAPLLTRLDIFLRPKLVRHMVCQRDTPLDFSRVMNRGGIFLGKLAQGAIGEENAALMGAFLVSKFHQTALSRQETGEDRRRNFYLYIDEFQHFITPSMASLLSGVRKFRMGLVLAHQELGQLGRDSELLGSILTNPYARICFRLGDADAKRLSSGFGGFESDDLMNLGTGQAIARLERAEYAFNLATFPLPDVDEATANERKEAVRARSRAQYGAARADVESLLARQFERLAEEREEQAEAKETRKTEPAKPKDKPQVPPTKFAMPELPIEAMTPPAAGPVTRPEAGQETRPFEMASPESIPGREGAETESEMKPRPPEAAPAASPAKSKTKAAPQVGPPTPGRGGQKHKYLQQLIKQWAEGMGWRAEIEKQILNGAGSVDVALTKGTVTVACEISVTTGVEQELGNIDKCLKAGYAYIVAVSAEAKQAAKIREAAAKRMGDIPENVRFLTVEEFLAFVEDLEAQAAGRESTSRGYKVKVQYRAADEEEKKVKKLALTQVILNSIKKMKR